MKYLFILSVNAITGVLLALNGYTPSKNAGVYWLLTILVAVLAVTLTQALFDDKK